MNGRRARGAEGRADRGHRPAPSSRGSSRIGNALYDLAATGERARHIAVILGRVLAAGAATGTVAGATTGYPLRLGRAYTGSRPADGAGREPVRDPFVP